MPRTVSRVFLLASVAGAGCASVRPPAPPTAAVPAPPLSTARTGTRTEARSYDHSAPGLAPRLDTLDDRARGRRVPVAVYEPAADHPCRRPAARPACGVAFLSPGYGVPHTAYAFLAGPLAAAGTLVVAIQHDLPTDPPPATTGTLVAVRTPLWARGAETLRFVRAALAPRHPEVDWRGLVLVGHSNGGDLSAFALRDTPALAAALVTLDNRRVPLPRAPELRVLTVRGSDFAADPGVLPDDAEARALRYCVARIAGARHDDLQDDGPAWLRAEVARRVVAFVRGGRCEGDRIAP